jgi:hypothetical protein
MFENLLFFYVFAVLDAINRGFQVEICPERLAFQGNRMNTVIRVRERMLFRPSPDKGRTGGVCSGEIGFFV